MNSLHVQTVSPGFESTLGCVFLKQFRQYGWARHSALQATGGCATGNQ